MPARQIYQSLASAIVLKQQICYNFNVLTKRARSSVDRALASGAMCGGSIPLGRTRLKQAILQSGWLLLFYFAEHTSKILYPYIKTSPVRAGPVCL